MGGGSCVVMRSTEETGENGRNRENRRNRGEPKKAGGGTGLVTYNCRFVGVGLGPQSRVPRVVWQRDLADREVT